MQLIIHAACKKIRFRKMIYEEGLIKLIHTGLFTIFLYIYTHVNNISFQESNS